MTRQVDVFQLTRQLIDIPSVTGEESQVGEFLARSLEEFGYQVESQAVSNGRGNVIATTGALPLVVLSTHMDTVPPHFTSLSDDEFIHGRGACDAKGIIAAQIAAAEKLRADGVHQIGLLFTVDEEAMSAGAKTANSHSLAASCRYLINGEPTDNRLAVGTKGSLQVTIRTRGRAAHSAYPEQGDSAIEKLLSVLDSVRSIDWPDDDVFGGTTCNIGVISGGVRSNVVAAEAQASVQIRLATNAKVARSLLEEAIAGRAELEYSSVHDPVRLLALDGFEQTIVRFTTDIPYLTNWGEPLLIGPGSILDAHTDHERVSKSDLFHAVHLYADLVQRLIASDETSKGAPR